MSVNSNITPEETVKLKCMLVGVKRLAENFSRYSKECSSVQVREEMQKLTASVLNQQSQLEERLGEEK